MPGKGGEQRTNDDSIIKPIDALSAHKITSGQVVIDLQTAVKELVENSLDAGATSIEVRFKNYGLETIEVVDNGTGICPADYESIALKHHTSKLSSFDDLASVATFGFRGEALSSLCALTESVTVTTATASEVPMGTILKFNTLGKLSDKSGRIARQRGTTVTISGLFKPLPVRRKELERNAKREFAKALHLLNAYALVPCANENGGVRLSCSNQPAGGRKSEQLRTDGSSSTRASVSALWGPKTLENLEDLDLQFEVETEKSVMRRLKQLDHGLSQTNNEVRVRGLISKFALNCGRSSVDRQFFYINGRPCQPSKVQKAFNEVYRTFNVAQSPLIIADFILPKDSLDINVSPDKRTIFIHSENNLVQALKLALEEKFAPERSTYNVHSGPTTSQTQTQLRTRKSVDQSLDNISTPPGSEEQADTQADGEESSRDTEQAVTKPKKLAKGRSLLLEVYDDEDQEMEPPTKSNSEPDTEGFGRPVLLMSGEAEFTRGDTMSLRDNLLPAPTASVGVEEESMDVDLLKDVVPKDSSVCADSQPLLVMEQHGIDIEPPLVPQSTSEDAVESLPPADSTTDVFEETIHQIPPPRFLSRSSGSGSSVSASSSVRAAPIRSLPVISSPPRTPDTRPQPDTGKVAKRNAGQMTLSTSGAAWNLQRQDDGDEENDKRVRKKPKTAETGKLAFKTLLAGYARPGSQIQRKQSESPSEEEAEDDDNGPAGRDDPVLTPDRMSEDNDMANAEEVGADTPRSHKAPAAEQSAVAGSSAVDTIDLTQAEDTSEDITMLVSGSTHPVDGEAIAGGLELPEIVKSPHRDMVAVRCDMGDLTARWSSRPLCRVGRTRSTNQPSGNQENDLTRDAGLSNTDDCEKADEVLSRIIEKPDFAQMEVLGQFNLGFIIARRQKYKNADDPAAMMDDLFIVDQHAADEKYNFETLQKTTKIASQKLFRPQPLELSAPDELIALDNLDVLRQNGFEIEVADDAISDTRHHRLKLVAQPVSKSTVFDLRDLEEIIHLLQDQPQGQMVRCSKARAMFATRACRKSIMVGMPLTTKQMTTVIRHMGTMHQPWNCPHGRPTMRYLSDISSVGWDPSDPRELKWREFLDNYDGQET